MDVVMALLNGSLDEEIYMQWPDGCIECGKEHLDWKLKKSLYDLKQSPHCWNKLHISMALGVNVVQAECRQLFHLHVRHRSVSECCSVCGWPNTAWVSRGNASVKESLVASLRWMINMGKLHYCLGISIEHDKEQKSLRLPQRQYILKLLMKYGLTEPRSF